MLHEQVRIYKRELYEAQASNTAHNRHVVRLQAEAKRMHEALQARKTLLPPYPPYGCSPQQHVILCTIVKTALKQSGHTRASKMVYAGTELATLILSVSRDRQLHQQTSYATLHVHAICPMHMRMNRLRPTAMKWHSKL